MNKFVFDVMFRYTCTCIQNNRNEDKIHKDLGNLIVQSFMIDMATQNSLTFKT